MGIYFRSRSCSVRGRAMPARNAFRAPSSSIVEASARPISSSADWICSRCWSVGMSPVSNNRLHVPIAYTAGQLSALIVFSQSSGMRPLAGVGSSVMTATFIPEHMPVCRWICWRISRRPIDGRGLLNDTPAEEQKEQCRCYGTEHRQPPRFFCLSTGRPGQRTNCPMLCSGGHLDR